MGDVARPSGVVTFLFTDIEGSTDLAQTSTRRALHLDRRAGWLAAPFYLVGMINILARSIAEIDPEGAAVLQGATGGLTARYVSATDGPVSAAGSERPNEFVDIVKKARREASEILVDALGKTPWRELRSQGQAMDRDQAAAYALTRVNQLPSSPVPDNTKRGGETDGITLTGRQLEVAQLVARGLSDKAIAERLDISAYTVETHVRNILERLDATNRTQIGAWVMANAEPPAERGV